MSKTFKSDFEKAYKTERAAKGSDLNKKEFEKLVLSVLKKNDDITYSDELMKELKKIDYVKKFPEDMYGAVAEIMAFIFSMDAKKRKDSEDPGEKDA